MTLEEHCPLKISGTEADKSFVSSIAKTFFYNILQTQHYSLFGAACAQHILHWNCVLTLNIMED